MALQEAREFYREARKKGEEKEIGQEDEEAGRSTNERKKG